MILRVDLPQASPDAPEDLEPHSHDRSVDRRQREVASAQRQIAEVIGQKVLHGWLQNRHQTAIPLNINVGRLQQSEAEAIVRFAAVAALAGGEASSPCVVRSWLAGVGTAPDLLATYDASLHSPPALDKALAAITDADLALIAFVLSLVAARNASPPARAFADYVAAHRSIPTATVRAALRRHGS
ncbi:hypothetical protein [Methylobacterium sp. CCH5-D2]|uniref:hypothetical protein n=1 Tax=Methylobacterium sp. CCH5-D2 TaxID=1768765 RepID=UPI00082F4AB2|nr:hypothetical protein [Methylobacterium sp. CCH5-D2]